jgi:hypothetical protein
LLNGIETYLIEVGLTETSMTTMTMKRERERGRARKKFF